MAHTTREMSCSSCSVERFYSLVGFTLDELRTSMLPETLIKWVYTAWNLRALKDQV